MTGTKTTPRVCLRVLTHRAASLVISSDDDKTATSSRTLKQSTSTAGPSFLATAPSFEDMSALELETVRSACILGIGCGNSLMPEQMAVENWVNVVACDFAPSVITQMDKRRLELAQSCANVCGMKSLMRVVCGKLLLTARSMSYWTKGHFDAALCGDHNITNAGSMLSECSRVLKDDGVFQCLTHGPPISRSDILKLRRFQWDLAVDIVSPDKLNPVPSQSPNDDLQDDTAEGLDLHYAYTCRKRPAKAPFRPTLQDIEDEEWAGS